MIVRDLAPYDVEDVREALVTCGAFTAEEVRVALEMVDAGLNGDYLLPAVEIDGRVRDYACLGKAGLTQGSWYLYWICVHRGYQGRGAGRVLQQNIEQIVRTARGDRLVVETSGRPDYDRSRRFYAAAGYTVAGTVPGFYKAGDDLVIYYKVVG